MEVRDGHLLAFLPRTTAAPNSRLKLTALSVMPVMGAGQANTLVLSRAARVMMVLKVSLLLHLIVLVGSDDEGMVGNLNKMKVMESVEPQYLLVFT